MIIAVLAAVAGAQSCQREAPATAASFSTAIILIKYPENLKVHAVRCGTIRQDFGLRNCGRNPGAGRRGIARSPRINSPRNTEDRQVRQSVRRLLQKYPQIREDTEVVETLEASLQRIDGLLAEARQLATRSREVARSWSTWLGWDSCGDSGSRTEPCDSACPFDPRRH